MSAGLAITQSVVAMTEVTILGIIMVIRDHKIFDFDFVRAIGRIISVTGFSAVRRPSQWSDFCR